MFDIEQVDSDIHNEIKTHVLSKVDGFDWYERYRPNCDVLIAEDLSMPILEKAIKDVFTELYDKEIFNFSWWINKYPYRAFQERHNHSSTKFDDRYGHKYTNVVFNYFLHLPLNSGSFVANDIILGDDMEGNIIFFPNTLHHEVTPNNSEEPRYTVSGNILIES